MPTQVQFRRGTTTQVEAFTGGEGEVVYDTQQKTLSVQDGTTPGGTYLATHQFANSAFDVANTAYSIASGVISFTGTATLTDGPYNLTLDANGVVNVPTGISGYAVIEGPDSVQISSNGNHWTFSTDGTTTIPGTISSNLIPTTANSKTLGSSAKPWHDLYIGTGNVNIGGIALSNNNGVLTITGASDFIVEGAPNKDIAFIANTANAAFNTLNVVTVVANAAFDKANSANVVAQAGFDKANAANVLAQTTFDYANNILVYAQSAYQFANTTNTTLSGYISDVFANANNTLYYSQSAYGFANAINTYSYSAYNKANNALANTTGTFGGSLTITGQANVQQRLAVGTGSYTVLPNLIAQFTGSSDTYSQINQQNLSANGSGDIVVTAPNGTDLVNYIDMGVAGNTYNNQAYNSWTMAYPNDGWLMVEGNPGQNFGGNVFIGTSTSGTGAGQVGDIVFIQGGNYEEVGRFALGKGLVVNTTTSSSSNSTGALVVKGGVGIKGAVYADSVYDNGVRITTGASDAYLKANGAFDKANSANVLAQAAYANGNNTLAYAQSAYGFANDVNAYAFSAYATANSKFSSSGGTIAGDTTVSGNLTVTGTTFYANTTNINVEDNIITLNSNVTGAPALNAGIEVNRGTSNTTSLIWNENNKDWEFTNDGVTYQVVASASNVSNTLTYATGGFNKANAANVLAQSAFDLANTANILAQAAYANGNNTLQYAQSAYGFANAINTYASAAYANGNNTLQYAQSAYGLANAVNTYASAAYANGNNTLQYAQSAYNFANGINTYASAAYANGNNTLQYAQAAYGLANDVNTYAYSAYALANSVNTYASAAYANGNNTLQYAQAAYANGNNTLQYAQAAYGFANSVNTTAFAAFDKANTKFNSSGGTISGDVTISGNNNLTVTGNLTVQGTSTVSYTNTLTLSNAMFSLHTTNTLAPLMVNDGLNIGLSMHYYDTQDRQAILVRENSTGYLIWYNTSTDLVGNTDSKGVTMGTFQTNALIANTLTSNTSGIEIFAYANTIFNAGNNTLTYATAGFNKANAANVLAQSAFDLANTSNILAQAAYANGNNTLQYAQSAYGFANNINTYASAAYANGNNTLQYAQAAYGFANNVNTYASSAYANGNNTLQFAQSGFNLANTANVTAQAAFNKANSVVQTGFTTISANGTSITPSSNADTFTITAASSNGINVLNPSSKTIDIGLRTTGVSAGDYGSSTNIPVIHVDEFGRITSASNSSISTSISLSGTSGTGSVAGGGTLTFAGSHGVTASASSSTITIDTPQDLQTTASPSFTNLSITGNLSVGGAYSYTNTAIYQTVDSLIELAANNAGDAVDIGFYGQYNSSGNKYAGLARSAGSTFVLFKDLSSNPTTNSVGSITLANYGTLRANLTGGMITALANTIGISDGGTNNSTYTTGALLQYNGTGIVSLANTGVSAGSYGNTTSIPSITVDAYGRVTAVSNNVISTSISLAANSGTGSVSGGGTLTLIGNTGISTYTTGSTVYINNTGVTSLATGSTARITVSAATGNISVDLATTAVTAGSYNYSNITVDSYGRITSAATGTPVTSFSGGTTGFTPSNTTNGAITLAGTLGISNGGSNNTSYTTGQIIYYDGSSLTSLANSGVTAGSYGNTTTIPSITVDALGRVTAVSNNVIYVPPGTSITANSGQLTANSATGNVALGLATTAVSAGTYGSSSNVASITVDSYGRITSASNVAITATAAIVSTTDTFTGNDVQTAFVLSQTPYNVNSTSVNINGVTQQRSTYSLSGSTLNLTTAPPSGASVEVTTNYNGLGSGTITGALQSTVDTFTADGASGAYTLTTTPSGINYTFVHVNGVQQNRNTYTLVGNVVTLGGVPTSGAIVEVQSFTSTSGVVVGLTSYGAANNAVYSSSSNTLTSGTLPINAGGSNATSYTSGQILYYNGTNFASLANSTASGSYTNASLTVDAYGRITSASSGTTAVTSVSGTTGQIFSSGGTTPTLNLANTAVTTGTYGGSATSSANIPVITVDQFGRLTSASNTSVAIGTTLTDDTSSATVHYPLMTVSSSGTITTANTSTTKLSYVPSTGTLTATTFSGSLSGAATSATSATNAVNATNANTTGGVSTSATYYPSFVASNSSGSQGLNTATALTFNPSTGTLSATILTSTSDQTLKENITPITNALDIINNIDGVKFNWKDNGNPSAGLIAQQVEQYLPELITIADGKKSLNYNGIIAVLVEAIKAQQVQIDALTKKKKVK